MVFQEQFQTTLFQEPLKRLRKQVKGKRYHIVDGHPVHKPAAAKRFASANATPLRLIPLPGCCPELNPDELFNQDVKTNALGKSRPTSKAEMLASARRHLHRRQKQPQVIRNPFQERHVRSAV